VADAPAEAAGAPGFGASASFAGASAGTGAFSGAAALSWACAGDGRHVASVKTNPAEPNEVRYFMSQPLQQQTAKESRVRRIWLFGIEQRHTQRAFPRGVVGSVKRQGSPAAVLALDVVDG